MLCLQGRSSVADCVLPAGPAQGVQVHPAGSPAAKSFPVLVAGHVS